MFSARQGFGGGTMRPFTITIDTTKPGTASNQFTLPAEGTYIVEWGDGTIEKLTTHPWPSANYSTHTYPSPGTYSIKIYGDLRKIKFYDTNSSTSYDPLKLIEISQWGDIYWLDMTGSFYGCSNMVATYTDAPNLTGLQANVDYYTNRYYRGGLGSMFENCTLFNGTVNNWDVSEVGSLVSTFMSSGFNQPINNWRFPHCPGVDGMFRSSPFNQDITGWDTSHVRTFTNLFADNGTFNQDLSSWNLSGLVSGTGGGDRNPALNSMFYHCTGLSTANMSKILIGWANFAYAHGGSPTFIDASGLDSCTYNNTNYGGSPYSDAVSAKAYLNSTVLWSTAGLTLV
jgi:hypothetical protein